MALDLWLWGMPLQNYEFHEKTNENWRKIMAYAAGQAHELEALYAYMDQLMATEAYLREQGDHELDTKYQAEIEALKTRIDQLILESGNTDTEVVDARLDVHGFLYTVLKDRMDAEQLQMERKSTLYFSEAGLADMKEQDLVYLPVGEGVDTPEAWFILDEANSDVVMEETDFSSAVPGVPGTFVMTNFGPDKRFQSSLKATLTPTPYKVGQTYLTGRVVGEPIALAYSIDGVVTNGGAVNGSTFTIYVSGKITNVSQVVKVLAYADETRKIKMGEAVVEVSST
ncbi:hypothetical protein X560_0374 [Listeria fleischmannii 1991]|uniref:Bacterial Ig domain-containing protein n=2 Tax=Listeria fleischmannii TaxID=1069827 RepID=A0A2X3HIU0_9LIST|nr:immunoglobulin-like domain-containing protein [Listeria fleischmannii]EMG27083.1 hypothetical protein LFLEISCH_13050 [Listeria fleischmannii subsp. fleischmannii LU2006-1]KMT60954.1 hypothetical protein X560_0374 [Listeria fleischmannii 1991]SQC70605.1 Uncharacterised protein [Listeria fleischmannii subsp. fleischmannii]